MSKNTFLFDTYAILEIINGNKNYEQYLDVGIVINDFVFAELCYKLFREAVKNADFYVENYSKFILNAEPGVIREAMLFRIHNLKKNLSMTDCISYIMAKSLHIKFLTSDKEFSGIENVEFVK